MILFGAFDRHNFGDLLLPHVHAATWPGATLLHAGLADRDLQAAGGFRTTALATLAARWRGEAPWLVHAGGEVLTCGAWEAAVMLQPREGLQPLIDHLEARPDERRAWIRAVLGTASPMPYVASGAGWPRGTRIVHLAIGGVGLPDVDAAARAEVLARLASASAVSVRDAATQAHLAQAGVAARLLPDPAALTAELFGARIARRGAAAGKTVARLRATLRQGYLAVQFSAEFGDDATLATIAAQLDDAAAAAGLGICLFRAGSAPWHDDLDTLRRAAARLRTRAVAVVESDDLWELCAVIAHGRAYAGSSLHGRIVATAFGLPGVSLRPPRQGARPGKVAAYVATWEGAETASATVVGPEGLAAALRHAMAVPAAQRRRLASALASAYRRAFAAMTELPF